MPIPKPRLDRGAYGVNPDIKPFEADWFYDFSEQSCLTTDEKLRRLQSECEEAAGMSTSACKQTGSDDDANQVNREVMLRFILWGKVHDVPLSQYETIAPVFHRRLAAEQTTLNESIRLDIDLYDEFTELGLEAVSRWVNNILSLSKVDIPSRGRFVELQRRVIEAGGPLRQLGWTYEDLYNVGYELSLIRRDQYELQKEMVAYRDYVIEGAEKTTSGLEFVETTAFGALDLFATGMAMGNVVQELIYRLGVMFLRAAGRTAGQFAADYFQEDDEAQRDAGKALRAAFKKGWTIVEQEGVPLILEIFLGHVLKFLKMPKSDRIKKAIEELIKGMFKLGWSCVTTFCLDPAIAGKPLTEKETEQAIDKIARDTIETAITGFLSAVFAVKVEDFEKGLFAQYKKEVVGNVVKAMSKSLYRDVLACRDQAKAQKIPFVEQFKSDWIGMFVNMMWAGLGALLSTAVNVFGAEKTVRARTDKAKLEKALDAAFEREKKRQAEQEQDYQDHRERILAIGREQAESQARKQAMIIEESARAEAREKAAIEADAREAVASMEKLSKATTPHPKEMEANPVDHQPGPTPTPKEVRKVVEAKPVVATPRETMDKKFAPRPKHKKSLTRIVEEAKAKAAWDEQQKRRNQRAEAAARNALARGR